MDKIKILVVDDIADIREYFSMILSKEPDMDVVGLASSGVEAIQKARELKPDVILMDIQMETRTAGIDATNAIKSFNPNIRVIILTIHEEDEFLFQAYCAGVMDYIVKTDSITQILNSIRTVYANKLMLRPGVADKIIDEFTRLKTQQESLIYILNIISKLTNSEFEILKCFYEGNSYKTISETRFVSQATIKSQVNSILKKFEMKTMKDVVKLLKQMNFSEIIKGTMT
ncbi:response regulator transcription factor [Mobilitalea sibirica]|uniref:Stage 0 sporulation protein A homolog n=1 Tax=Mobilitalea sibirica TaxID=1462919 RepID=A0A8J7H8A9_9FIRM|nr:response regulator transcription factor [Mobilitalea sibirica]MBH1940115.1 response regulator transcription factor [Mobilitalea sibirica]